MKILALELSSSVGSIALRENSGDSFAAEFRNDRKHSGAFFENLQRCLATRGAPELIVVGLGPGSYAGTRIAIAAAIGLGAATGAALGGLPSIVAMPVDACDYVVVGDARRESFFFARISKRRCIEGPELFGEGELEDLLGTIEVPIVTAEPLPRFPSASVVHPSAPILAEIAANRDDLTAPPLEPIYLRAPHITQPRPARL
ncbi:MAG TPA: tRNA (adenosine(37)-N6)-threonylcarbamoyltransferase complex dimerization subunit type 1 TsaB [Chthoniobacterales bacterium]|jgi:tRNA threonylcarbamoyladenosine biosynthesis protein TsaB